LKGAATSKVSILKIDSLDISKLDISELDIFETALPIAAPAHPDLH
jgi:hypothetical protein